MQNFRKVAWPIAGLLALTGICPVDAQPVFQKQIDGLNGLFCIDQSPGGVYWLGTFLGKIVRLDADGQWLGAFTLQKGDTASTRFIYDIECAADGGAWALFDRNNDNTALDDYLILARLAPNGLPLWQRSVHYGEVLHWAHNRLCVDPAENVYAMSARFGAPGSGEPSRIILGKVAPDGAMQWSKAYFNAAVNYPRTLQRLADGTLLLSGNGQLASLYGFVLRLSQEGEILWSRRYNRLLFKAFAELPGGDWVFAATETGPLPQAACVLRMTPGGDVVWCKRLVMPYALNWLPGLTVTPGGEILVFNYETPKDQPVPDMICLSADGTFLWARRYDLCHNYGISAGIITNDGGITGIRYRPGGHLVLKTDITGNCAACPAEDLALSMENITDSPLSFDWQTENRPAPLPASSDFFPFNAEVADFCGKDKSVTGLSLSSDTLCVFQPLSVDADGPGQADEYSWFFPGGTPAVFSGFNAVSGIRYSVSGATQVTLATKTGLCRDTFTVPLVIRPGPSPIDLGSDTIICGTDVFIKIDATTAGASDYLWNDGVSGPLREIDSTGQYIVTASAGECTATDTIRLQVLEGLALALPGDTTICGADTLWLDATAPEAESYRWNDGYEIARRPVTRQGYYAVTAFRGNCTASDFIAVDLFPRPSAIPSDTIVCDHEAVTFDVGESISGEIRWNGEPGRSEFIFEDTGWVRRLVEYRNCRYEDSVYVHRADCRDGFAYFAPNVFSPNSDGENDQFEIFGEGLEVLAIQVFDRWGNLVFSEKNGNLVQWDGFSGSRTLQSGVYIWSARVRQRGREGNIGGDILLLK